MLSFFFSFLFLLCIIILLPDQNLHMQACKCLSFLVIHLIYSHFRSCEGDCVYDEFYVVIDVNIMRDDMASMDHWKWNDIMGDDVCKCFGSLKMEWSEESLDLAFVFTGKR